ncbi:MAG: DUF4389 domain-containing protein [Chitinispirillaceae bacterium]|nr:DUF4389 domain-containing protein [Chitinispirillaceae bacterium]
MQFNITRQESYSRGELLIRSIFGGVYIAVPHYFLLFFVGIWSGILGFIAFWAVLFTGRYPESMFEFQIRLLRWTTRVSASLYNLIDGYPAFGLNGTCDKVTLEVEYPESLSRGLVIVRLLFGLFYCAIPHGFCLFFRFVGTSVLMFLAWWVVLFTGSYPAGWHEFNAGTLRWTMRLQLYLGLFTDQYPAFSGKA